jgi:8-oxo-dGTP pyrophosphatase MutT (NUDIX family)
MIEPQKYKIYINHTLVTLKATEDLTIYDARPDGSIIVKYSGKPVHLLKYISLLEKPNEIRYLTFHYENYKKLKNDFKAHFSEIEAAGGLVVNELNEFLFIYRRGSWDLPKGKIDKGETKKEATMREISEETGVKNMKVIRKIMVTRHTYRGNVGRRFIKKTHWFLLSTTKQTLIPQVTEDIEKAVWMSLQSFFNIKRPVYPNILDVIHTQDIPGIESKVSIKIK